MSKKKYYKTKSVCKKTTINLFTDVLKNKIVSNAFCFWKNKVSGEGFETTSFIKTSPLYNDW